MTMVNSGLKGLIESSSKRMPMLVIFPVKKVQNLSARSILRFTTDSEVQRVLGDNDDEVVTEHLLDLSACGIYTHQFRLACMENESMLDIGNKADPLGSTISAFEQRQGWISVSGWGAWCSTWLKLPACKIGDRGFKPHWHSSFKETLVKIQYCEETP